MTLQDQGKRFYVSPDKKEGRWMSPVYQAHSYPDWKDVTELSLKELEKYLMESVDTESEVS